MRPRPMITVADVEASSQWYCAVLGLRSGHGGDEYEMLLADDELVLQLHHWDVDEHPHLGDPSDRSRGNGAVLWFAADDFDGTVERVRSSGASIIDGPLENPLAHHREVWLRDLDGYCVVVSGA